MGAEVGVSMGVSMEVGCLPGDGAWGRLPHPQVERACPTNRWGQLSRGTAGNTRGGTAAEEFLDREGHRADGILPSTWG